ncbi:hypothetical protein [Pandoraea bronchicola]|uniref:Uncharacterized protein n=1 Tax=Pandoraea bronchicola TaxID=2508287 RepID=A0A5E5BST3_9BURK|nr:hypothetical protein [Pandoraea bronchicola]VVE88135.1 hypothetical protein PBR20603_02084 [Pandoraea bronchicola]
MSTASAAQASRDDSAISFAGPFEVNKEHEVPGILDTALSQFVATAQKIAIDFIQDAQARAEYMRQIGEIPKLVRAEVAAGRVGVAEGVVFAQTMRNQIMMETRAATSAGTKAIIETYKREGRSKSFLLEKYSVMIADPGAKARMSPEALNDYVQSIADGKRPSVFQQLTQEQRSRVYYAIIDAAGKDSAKFSTRAVRLAAAGKVFTALTTILVLTEIFNAKDKVQEINRQGSILGGSLMGGVAGSALVSPVCGPGAPICAFVLILVGGMAGGTVAEKVNDLYQEELRHFRGWRIK